MLEATYELLRTTPPFRGWKLPPADEVEFHLMRFNDRGADYERKPNGTHCIRVNEKWCGNLTLLLRYMAHEMVHLHHGTICPSDSAHHGTWFKKLAATVCRHHHLDPKSF